MLKYNKEIKKEKEKERKGNFPVLKNIYKMTEKEEESYE